LGYLDDERGRETVFATAEKANLFHDVLLKRNIKIVKVSQTDRPSLRDSGLFLPFGTQH
jgi:hypothetical protein